MRPLLIAPLSKAALEVDKETANHVSLQGGAAHGNCTETRANTQEVIWINRWDAATR